MTRFPDPVSGACRARPRSPRPRPLAPSAPQTVARPCSPTSPLLWPGLTSHARASPASALRPSRCGPPVAGRPAVRSPGSRARSIAHVPGSQTTRSQPGARDPAPARVAFRPADGVGTPDGFCFVAQWLAHALPCRRFASHLAVRNARLGASVVRYSFTVRDLHPLLLAGLPAHLQQNLACRLKCRRSRVADLTGQGL